MTICQEVCRWGFNCLKFGFVMGLCLALLALGLYVISRNFKIIRVRA